MKSNRTKILKNTLAILLCLTIFIVCSLSFLTIGFNCYHHKKFWSPSYSKIDLNSILDKPTLSESDYKIIYEQTGVKKIGVDSILAKNDKKLLLRIQEDFFASYDYYHHKFAPLLCAEMLSYNSPHTVPLEDGDILISPTTHFSIFEFGHSAIVFNGQNRQIINALNYFTPTKIDNANFIVDRPTFIILRVKANKEVRKEVAKFAINNLLGIEYSIFSGAFYPKYEKELKRTQCAHLIWYAYFQFGIDLDSNGGMIVMPRDIFNSKNVEIVQVYGLNPYDVW